MNPTTEPRYIAYTSNAFGHTEAGRTNRKATAWTLARAATTQAKSERPNIDHTAEIFDKRANNGQGGTSFRVNTTASKTEFILVYLSSASEYNAPAFYSRKAAQKYKDDIVSECVEIMTRKQLAQYIAGAQQCVTQDEQNAFLDKILNR